MKAQVFVMAAGLVLLALATPYSLIGLAEVSPVGSAEAHVCMGNPIVCCPVNLHHSSDVVNDARDCL